MDFTDTIGFLIKLGYQESKQDADCYTVPDKEYVIDREPHTIRGVPYAMAIIIGSGVGYSGFSCHFYFDAEGKFLNHGCWE